MRILADGLRREPNFDPFDLNAQMTKEQNASDAGARNRASKNKGTAKKGQRLFH